MVKQFGILILVVLIILVLFWNAYYNHTESPIQIDKCKPTDFYFFDPMPRDIRQIYDCSGVK